MPLCAQTLLRMRRFLALAGFVAAACAPAAWAGGTLQCVSLEYPPLVFTGPDGKAQGIAVEVVEKTLAKGGWSVQLEILPWARALDLMQRGQRDCVFTIFKTPEREAYLDFSTKPLLQQPIALYANTSANIRYAGDLSALRDKSFLVVHSINYGQRFEAERPHLQTIQAYSGAQAFEKLAQNQADLTISNVYLAAYQLAAAGPSVAGKIVQLQPVVETVSSYIAFAKGKHTEARQVFDTHIDQVVYGSQRATFERLLDRYNVPHNQRASLMK